jgi:hypothetical protein
VTPPAFVWPDARTLTAAARWRSDHAQHEDRDAMWSAFRTGKLWGTRGDERAQVRAALDEAERTEPWHLPPGRVPMRP